MIYIIAKRLKLNVTNIKSSLISNSKKIKKINSEKNTLFSIIKKQENVGKKETKIESSNKMSIIQSIGKKLLSGPLSLIDKFKEFFGLIMLGIVVNNLPTIIKKLQDIFGKIKEFFDNNSWIGNTIKFAFDIIAKGMMSILDLTESLMPIIGGSFKFALDTIQTAKNNIGNLIGTFDQLDNSVSKFLKTFPGNPLNQNTQTSAQTYAKSKGKYYSSTTKKTYNNYTQALQDPQVMQGAQKEVVKQITRQNAQKAQLDKKRVERARKAQATPSQAYDPNTGTTKLGTEKTGYVPKILAPLIIDGKKTMGAMEPGKRNTWKPLGPQISRDPVIMERYTAVRQANKVQKFSVGGTIKNFFSGMFGESRRGLGNISPQEGTGRGSPSDTKLTTKGDNKSYVGPYASPAGTAKGRKARETVNYFQKFKQNVSNYEEISNKNEENNNSFFNILKKLNEVKNLRLKVKDDAATRRPDLQTLPDGTDPDGPGPDGSLPTGSPEVFEGQGVDRVWNFFKGKGLSDIAVSGIMGNAQQESGFNPTIAHSESIQGKPAKFIGIFQWDNNLSGDRWGKLVNWAKASNLNPESIDTQLKWTWKELSGPEALSLKEIKKAQTPEQAAQIWYDEYERASHGLTERQNYAKGFYKKYKGKIPKAIVDLNQSRLPALPDTNTIPGGSQRYGAPRDDNGDGIPDRRHAGVDYDINGNEKFYSRIGGEVIRAGFKYGKDGYGVDIYNSRINMTERIAEATKVLVRVGDTVVPGDAVVQGESATGVIHYELRKGKAGSGGDFAGTVNPVKFLKDLDAKQNTQPINPKNLTTLAKIQNITNNIKQPEIEVSVKDKNGNIIYYKIKKNGNELKFSKKIDPFGLLEESIDIKKGNTEFLKDILNELKFKTKEPVEPGSAAASLITPMSRNYDIASLGSNYGQEVLIVNRTQPIVVHNVDMIQTIRKIGTNSGNNNSSTASRIFAGARDVLV